MRACVSRSGLELFVMAHKLEKLSLEERMHACQSGLSRNLNSNSNPAFVPQLREAPKRSEMVSRFPYRVPFDFEEGQTQFSSERMMQHRKQARRPRPPPPLQRMCRRGHRRVATSLRRLAPPMLCPILAPPPTHHPVHTLRLSRV